MRAGLHLPHRLRRRRLLLSTIELPPLVDGDLELVVTADRPADPARDRVRQLDFALRVRGEHVAGEISLRVGSTPALEMYAGHIGYGVEPEDRGHHYAARACVLVLEVARRLGMTTLWITCNPDNVASRRTCELAGGQLVEIVDLPPDIDMFKQGERQKCRYRFAL